MKNVKFCQKFLETKVTNLDDYACPKVQNSVQKEKHLHTEHGLDVFLINCEFP